ncbi:unnamed protein product [Cuscuta epithymum]|uniref:non-specific serine/threonine protein kinase n=1 Tax=Cuscuta epithymum TaxID=186058 RepID=A0AAV0E730_9ASTE|nr:unnamed protein product [Cuscuta epithymum]CAH9147724.1 unnamed protein product [Cuscuta epithymum]
MNQRLLSRKGMEVELSLGTPEKRAAYSTGRFPGQYSRRMSSFGDDIEACWPRNRYSLEEMEGATNGFASWNVISCGDHAIVYRGVLSNHTRIAIKRLLSNSDEAEEFIRSVERVWCIRHRNLVKLVGFCMEGMYRALVYEYVDNGTLKHWLHDYAREVSPLTWSIRMNIIIGVAKGLAFLHEDSEPLLVHQNLKSHKILLDKQWNPKISDFGITSPSETACTEFLDEKSDVYSFGILIMEIISGKMHKFDTATETEECLIDWIKIMVERKRIDELVDPKLAQMPSAVELKRIILIALRCVDPDADDRPKMGEVIHMLEPRDLLLSDERVIKKQTSRRSSVKEEDVLQAAAALH